MQRIFEFFRALLFDWRKNRAIREAQRSAELHRKKFLVLVLHGRPVCVSMQGVKKMIRQKRLPGLTAEKAREIAIFVTGPGPLCLGKEPMPNYRANESRAALVQAMPNVAGNHVKRKNSGLCS